MPKDEWENARRKDVANTSTRKYRYRPGVKKSDYTFTVAAGTRCLMRRAGSNGEFKPYVTRLEFSTRKFLWRTEKAFLFRHKGYEVWVSDRLVKQTI